jgi:hypothetical protein
MQLSRKVLANLEMYMRFREAQSHAAQLEDTLMAAMPNMTPGEAEAYAHMCGMYEIGQGNTLQERTYAPPPAPSLSDTRELDHAAP